MYLILTARSVSGLKSTKTQLEVKKMHPENDLINFSFICNFFIYNFNEYIELLDLMNFDFLDINL